MSAPRVRIAPSPTGDPHVGTAYVALFNRAYADASGGRFVLRIDDTDRKRYRPESEEAIVRCLRWLGLEWDEGPDKGGPHAPYRQSERTALYREAAERLVATGAAYRCFCTPERLTRLRESQMAARQDPGYDGACRDLPAAEVAEKLAAGESHTVRLRVPDHGATTFNDELRGTVTVENAHIDDQVLMKSDGFPTYHLANCVDDAVMGITEVIRAEEWLVSTPKHILIYDALDEPLPRFFHVPLLRNADRSKISKRKNPVSLDYYRDSGYLPEALLNFLALLGWSPPDGEEVFGYEQFRDRFRLEDLSTGGPVFDLTKLQWLNGVWVRSLELATLATRLREGGFIPEQASDEAVGRVLPLVAERIHLLTDFAELTDFYFHGVGTLEREVLVPRKATAADGVRLFEDLGVAFASLDDWAPGAIEALLETRREALDLKKPQLFMPLRMALTGKRNSPPLPEVMAILGRETVLERLAAAGRELESGAGSSPA